MDVKYYCINLADETERRHRIQNFGASAGISIQLITAVRGNQVDLQTCDSYDKRKRRRFAKDLTLNEVACVLSHKKALNTFLLSDHEFAVILEDDADFDDDFHQKVATIAKRVKGFDTVNLYSNGRYLSDSGDLNFTRVVVHTKLSFRTVAYLYSRNGADKVAKSLNNFYHAYDTHLSFAWRYGLLSVGIDPPIVRHPECETSTIGSRFNDRVPGLLPWWRRRSERIVHSFMKRLWALVVTRRVTVIDSSAHAEHAFATEQPVPGRVVTG